VKQNYLKTLSLQASSNLHHIDSEVNHAARQSRCAEFFHYAVNEELMMRLNRSNFCQLRTCPLCCWLKSAKWRIRIFQGLPRLLQNYPGFSFLFLTLTVRNCHFAQLRSHLRTMEQGWSRLSQLDCFPGAGYLKSLEISRPRDCFFAGQFVGRMGTKVSRQWLTHLEARGFDCSLWSEHPCEEVHPHFHVLMMVSPQYFQVGNYMDNARWQFLWRRAARLDYNPVVDIREVTDVDSGVFEVSKYCLKSTDMVDTLGCLTVRQLHGLRLLSIGGAFADYFSQAAMDAIAQSGDMDDEYRQLGVPCHYEWDGVKYQLTRLGQLTRPIS